MNAAQRIHEAQRIKAKRKDYENVQPNAKSLGRAVHTSTTCSCRMCGNPRKWFGERTMQERNDIQTEGWDG